MYKVNAIIFVYIFENGKGVKVSMKNYETKSNRRKLTGAYSTASPIVGIFYEDEPFNLILVSDNRRAIMISTKLIPEKSTRSAGGVTLFNIKKNQKIAAAFKETDASAINTVFTYASNIFDVSSDFLLL